MAETGQRVGDYEVLAPLGAGGMGRVYKVRNVISNREEAMKILLPDFAADPDLAARFMAEIRTLAGLDHPGIAQLRTAFQYQNQFVMVMEYVEGVTLEKLGAETRLPLDHVLDYSLQVLAALSYAHSKGVTHRDIKPANIMITTHGVIKLMDFGIAKSTGDMQLTRPGSTMGSVYYMSPEQVRGGTVDGRSDLYSFGVTLYEMLTGRKPFQADTSYSVLNAHMNEAPTPPLEVNAAISAELSGIVLHAMAKSPEGRFQSAEEFRSALKGLHEPQAAAIAETMPLAGNGARVAPPTQAPQNAGVEAQQYTAPPPPPFTPVAMPVQPARVAGKTHRGLWIGLGAATAILALIAVAAVLPRMLSTHASPKPAAVSPADAGGSPAAVTAVSPAAAQTQVADQAVVPTTPAVDTPAAKPVGTENHAGAGKGGASQAGAAGARPGGGKTRPDYVPSGTTAVGSTGGGTAGGGTTTAVPSGPSPQEMRAARDRLATLEARGDAALAGVDQIRSQQRAQGLDLRGDIVGAMNRLHHQMDEARRAVNEKQLDTAREYMDNADRETAVLEKFLGR